MMNFSGTSAIIIYVTASALVVVLLTSLLCVQLFLKRKRAFEEEPLLTPPAAPAPETLENGAQFKPPNTSTNIPPKLKRKVSKLRVQTSAPSVEPDFHVSNKITSESLQYLGSREYISSDMIVSSKPDITQDEENTGNQIYAIFESVLSKGLVVTLHSKKGSTHVLMKIIENTIRLKYLKQIFGTKYIKIDFSDVDHIHAGKSAQLFQLQSNTAVEEHCFSIATSKEIYDIEVCSKAERDALVYGFTRRKGNM